MTTSKTMFPRFRVHSWFDTSQMKERFGVQKQTRKEGRWFHACREDGTIFLSDDRKDAEGLCKNLREANS